MYKKKLIEVALPVDAINSAAQTENANPFMKGHPKSLKWWARRPLAASRAVVLASLLDDPSSDPVRFPTAEAQDAERQRLLDLVARACPWDSIQDSAMLEAVHREIREHVGDDPPTFCDPFAGGGSIPLEAQRLGLTVVAGDLNPVALLINRSLLQVSQRFGSVSAVNPERGLVIEQGARAMASDLRWYGQRISEAMRDEVGKYWPTPSQAGGKARVVAWIWARTVESPNPAWNGRVPLARSFELASRGNQKIWAEPEVDPVAHEIRFVVKVGSGPVPAGTVSKAGATCLATGVPIDFEYIRSEGRAGRIGQQLLAVVVDRGKGKKTFEAPADEDVEAAVGVPDIGGPTSDLPERALGFRVQAYGLTQHRQLFTPRQVFGLETLVQLIQRFHATICANAEEAGLVGDGRSFGEGGTGPLAYADALTLLLSEALGRAAMFHGSLCKWNKTNENIANPFALMTLSMTWDFAEGNLIDSPTDFRAQCEKVAEILETAVPAGAIEAEVVQADARHIDEFVKDAIFSTDPPYYDNAGYADLSDYFFVWIRRVLAPMFPVECSTLLTPKTAELIASPDRHSGGKSEAKQYFEDGLRSVFGSVRNVASPGYPFTIHYAFKQQESKAESGKSSTGWETMLEGLQGAGWSVVGTWPLRTEREARSRNQGSNALASSIVLVCRPRDVNAPLATRKELVASLREALPEAVRALRAANVAPVDLAQAAIGPGMAVFTQFSRVVEADGAAMSVRAALELINQVLDETISGTDSDFDHDTRWAVTWFEDCGMAEGTFGRAEQLSKSRNTSVDGLAKAGVIIQRPGKVRLAARDEMDDDWDPRVDARLTVWEVTQQLIRRLESDGESSAASLLAAVGSGLGETAKELAYRLYLICDRKGWAKEGNSFNSLVTAWPEITRLAVTADEASFGPGTQGELL